MDRPGRHEHLDDVRLEAAVAAPDVGSVVRATTLSAMPPDPRYVLANERTLLAWLRTSIALMAAGLAAVGFLEPSVTWPVGLLVGSPLIILGGFAAVAGYRRWRDADRALRTGAVLPETRAPLLMTAVVVAVGVAAMIVIVQLP